MDGDSEERVEKEFLEPELELQDRHWMSYSVNNGRKDVLDGQLCTASVVLDAGAHKSFSGIRTIIVCKVSEELNKVASRNVVCGRYQCSF
jgi:hypothetical protein